MKKALARQKSRQKNFKTLKTAQKIKRQRHLRDAKFRRQVKICTQDAKNYCALHQSDRSIEHYDRKTETPEHIKKRNCTNPTLI